jgi:hypothetical protein
VADKRGDVWLAYRDSATVIRVGRDGGITEFPLTEARPDSDAYAEMILLNIHYDLESDSLVLVTRGSLRRHQIYRIFRLQ